MTNRYDDIIRLEHPASCRHPRMPAMDRAAQFSSFAALTGYEGVLRETARLTGTKIELDEDCLVALDRKLRFLCSHLTEQPEVSITYFEPDKTKDGGAYQTMTGIVKKIDPIEQVILMRNTTIIPIDRILEISGSCFVPLDAEKMD